MNLDFRTLGPSDEGAVVLYERGHHAPMRLVARSGAPRPRSMEDLGRTTVTGSALVDEVILGCAGDSCRHNIGERIPIRIGDSNGRIQRPRFGLSFSSRVIEIESGNQLWAVVPTWGPVELRRGGVGGEPMAARSTRRRQISEEATAEDLWNMTRILSRLLFGWLQGI